MEQHGLPKEDADLYAYQLLAKTTDTVGIHEGTIMNYHQTQMNSTDEASYQDGLDLLRMPISATWKALLLQRHRFISGFRSCHGN